MKPSKRTSNLFRKYLLSYSLIFMLPFLILGGLVYWFFIDTFQHEVLANNTNQMELTRSVIDDRIAQLHTISTQITLNQELRFNRALEDPMVARSTIASLKNFAVTNKFINEIFLYVHGDQHILSSTSSLPITTMNKFLYAYPNWKTQDFIDALTSSKYPSVRPAETMIADTSKSEQKQVVTFIYPLSFDGVSTNRTLLIQVNEDYFTNLMTDSNDKYAHYSFILDDQNRTIASNISNTQINIRNISPLIQGNNPVKQTVSLQNKTYILSYVKSKETSWTYITLIPNEQVLQKVTSVKLLFLYTITIILLIGTVVILALMKMNYQPLQQLIRYTENIGGATGTTRNDLESVKGTLDYLNTQNQQLNTKVENHAEAARNFFIFQLLKGGFRSSDELCQKAMQLGYDWAIAKSAFQVATFHLHQVNYAFDERESWGSISELAIPSHIQVFARNDLEQNKIIVLFMFDTQITSITLEIEAVKVTLQMQSKGYVTLGLGHIYYSPEQIPTSYLESLAAVDYRYVLGAGQTIHYDDIRFTSPESPIIKIESDKLRNFLKQGNVTALEKYLEELIVKMKSSNMPVSSAKIICLEIIYCVLDTVEEMSKTMNIVTSKFPDVYHLSSLETIDELVTTVTLISTEISNLLNQKSHSKTLTLTEQLKQYVHQNCYDPEFSVVAMAAKFGMSQAYLSQYFKEHTGSTITEFETALKIERAQQLLKTTKMPVKDIALEVGYYSVNSFLRRFKQVTGVTPGDYRNYFA